MKVDILPDWHGMSESGSIRVKNLQSMVASVRDSIHSNLGLKIRNIPARYDGDLTVRELRQHLQGSLGLRRDDGQGGPPCEESQCPVKVKDDSKLGGIIYKLSKVLLEIVNI